MKAVTRFFSFISRQVLVLKIQNKSTENNYKDMDRNAESYIKNELVPCSKHTPYTLRKSDQSTL